MFHLFLLFYTIYHIYLILCTKDHSSICTVIYPYQYVCLICLHSHVYLHAFRARVCFPPISCHWRTAAWLSSCCFRGTRWGPENQLGAAVTHMLTKQNGKAPKVKSWICLKKWWYRLMICQWINMRKLYEMIVIYHNTPIFGGSSPPRRIPTAELPTWESPNGTRFPKSWQVPPHHSPCSRSPWQWRNVDQNFIYIAIECHL